MAEFELKALNEVPAIELLQVLTDPRISRHLPLFEADIDLLWVERWVEGKITQWLIPELGPYAVLQAGAVAGWAGYQPDGESAELAIVLRPEAWGIGRAVIAEVERRWQKYGDGRKRIFYLPTSRNPDLISKRLNTRFCGTTSFNGFEFNVFEISG